MAIYSIEEILNAVYSGTTLSGTASAAEILNTVFNGTDALQISGGGGGLADGTVDGNLVIWDDTAGEWVEATLTEAGLAPIAPSTAAEQILIPDGSGGWKALTGPSSDVAPDDVVISGADAFSGAVTFPEGADVTLKAGDGASGSAGLANGGDLHLGGGVGYGTGTAGDVIVDRGRLGIGGVPSDIIHITNAGAEGIFVDGSNPKIRLRKNALSSSAEIAFLNAAGGAVDWYMGSADGSPAWSDGNGFFIGTGLSATTIPSMLIDPTNGIFSLQPQGIPRYITGTKTLTEATPTNLFTVALAEDSGATVELTFSVIATDGTTTELHSGKVIVDAINTNGTITSDVNHIVAQESGLPLPSSITDVFAVSTGTNEFTISTTMTSGLTTPTMTMYWTVINNSPGTITVL